MYDVKIKPWLNAEEAKAKQVAFSSVKLPVVKADVKEEFVDCVLRSQRLTTGNWLPTIARAVQLGVVAAPDDFDGNGAPIDSDDERAGEFSDESEDDDESFFESDPEGGGDDQEDDDEEDCGGSERQEEDARPKKRRKKVVARRLDEFQ